MSSLRRKVAAAPRALKLLVAVGFVHALAWAVLAAPLSGPDEINHAAFVQHVAETGHGVQSAEGSQPYSTQLDTLISEGGLRQTSLNPNARPTLEGFSAVARRSDAVDSTGRKNGVGPTPVASNPPLYYYGAAVVYRLSPDTSLTARLFLIRIVTALSMPLLVWMAWLIGAELFVSVWPRALMAALVALQPKLAFMCAVINPDALLFVFSTLTLLLGIRIVKRGATPLAMGLMGASAGAAVLTHGRGVAAVLLALLVAAITLTQRGDLRARAQGLGAMAGAIAVPALIALLYTRAHTSIGAFGGEVGQAGSSHFSVSGFASSVWQFYLPKLDFMQGAFGVEVGYRQVFVEGFFGQQGTLTIEYSSFVNSLIQLAAGAGLLVLFVVVVRRFEYLLTRWREVTVVAGAFVLMMFVLHYTDYHDRIDSHSVLISGRYLLPAVAIYAATAAFVLNSLPRKLGAALGGALVAFNITLALGALMLAVERLNA